MAAPKIRRGQVVVIETEDGIPMIRRIVEIRTTPDGFQFICASVGPESERRWGKSKRPEHRK